MIAWSEFGCGGWYERLNLKTIPPSLPCGGDDPEHYRDFHPEIAVVHRELHVDARCASGCGWLSRGEVTSPASPSTSAAFQASSLRCSGVKDTFLFGAKWCPRPESNRRPTV
jgi:hypothetical protein